MEDDLTKQVLQSKSCTSPRCTGGSQQPSTQTTDPVVYTAGQGRSNGFYKLNQYLKAQCCQRGQKNWAGSRNSSFRCRHMYSNTLSQHFWTCQQQETHQIFLIKKAFVRVQSRSQILHLVGIRYQAVPREPSHSRAEVQSAALSYRLLMAPSSSLGIALLASVTCQKSAHSPHFINISPSLSSTFPLNTQAREGVRAARAERKNQVRKLMQKPLSCWVLFITVITQDLVWSAFIWMHLQKPSGAEHVENRIIHI